MTPSLTPSQITSALASAWNSAGPRPDLWTYVDSAGITSDTIEELVLLDARCRRARGLPCGLEHYWETHLWFREDPGAIEQLVLHDLGTRAPSERQAREEELLARFPTLEDTIRLASDLQSLLAGEEGDDSPDWPQRLGNYELRQEIGRGSYGSVWKSWDRQLERYVALKLIPLDEEEDPLALEALLAESRSAACIDNPHVVKIHGSMVFREAGLYAIDSQLIGTHAPTCDDPHAIEAGRSLEAVRNSEEKGWRWAATMMVGSCQGVAAAHARGVIHRDIKPANIVTAPTGHPVVSDFGLAAQAQYLHALRPTEGGTQDSVILHERGIVGTPLYMAPEQARGENATPLSDVYGLGATLHFLLSGHPPFDERAPLSSVLKAVIAGRRRALPSAVPRPLRAIVAKAMSLHPEDRYPSPLSMAQDLELWMGHHPTSVSDRGPLRRSSLWLRRNPVLWILCLLLFGLGAFHLRARAKSQAELEHSLEGSLDIVTLLAQTIDRLETNGLDPETQITLFQAIWNDPNVVGILERKRSAPASLSFLAMMHECLGGAEFRRGRFPQSLDHRLAALDLLKRLVRLAPNDPRYQARLSIAHVVYGDSLRQRGDLKQGLREYLAALEIDEGLVKKYPKSRHFRDNLSWSYERLAVAASKVGDFAKSWDYHRRRHALARQLFREQPSFPQCLYNMIASLRHLAQNEKVIGEREKARELVAEAMVLSKELLRLEPKNLSYLQSRADTLFNWVQLSTDPDERRQMRRRLEEGIEILEQILDRGGPTPLHRMQLARARMALGWQLHLSDPKESIAQLTQALTLLRQLDKEAEAPPPARLFMDTLSYLARVHASSGDAARAKEFAKECVSRAFSHAQKGDLDSIERLELERLTPLFGQFIKDQSRRHLEAVIPRINTLPLNHCETIATALERRSDLRHSLEACRRGLQLLPKGDSALRRRLESRIAGLNERIAASPR